MIVVISYKWKNGMTDSIDNNFPWIRVASYNSLSNEKIMSFHNVIVLIKSVVNKNKNTYDCNIFI